MSENPNNVTAPVNNTAPVSQLRTNRGLAKFIILSILTLGIYSLVVLPTSPKRRTSYAAAMTVRKP